MWNSETYGKLNIEKIPEKLRDFYDRSRVYGEPIEVTIGTDSQNHASYTKIVTVISIICKHHGGIFFHRTRYTDLIMTVREKLETETNLSLEIAQKLIELMDDELMANCPLSIHIDAGNAGKSRDLIQALTGWVHSMGYDCEVKPNSYAASSIADRISK